MAVGAGVMTGLLAVGLWFEGVSSLHDPWVAPTVALAIVLVFDSFVALVGPRRVFYSSAFLSALLAASEWIGSGSGAAATLLTIAAAGATLCLSVVAARFEPQVSEQSHPMNLPVFG